MDFSVREAPLAPCAQCGIPIRYAGRASSLFCCPACRITREVFGDGRGHIPKLRLGVGFGALALLIVVSLALRFGLVEAQYSEHFLWLQALLFVPAFWAFGLPQLLGPSEETSGFRYGSVVASAALATALYSAFELYRGTFVVFFESAALVLLFAAIADLLESTSRAHAIKTIAPVIETPASSAEFKPGDVFQVKPGETVLADGVLLEGNAVLSTLKTDGSAEPRTGGPGLAIQAGSVNLGGELKVRVDKELKATRWYQKRRAALDLLLDRDNLLAGPGAFFASTAFPLLIAAIAAFVFNLKHGLSPAWVRTLAVLAAGGAGALMTAGIVALAATLRAMSRLNVTVPSIPALLNMADEPVAMAGVGLGIPMKPTGGIKFLDDEKDMSGGPAAWSAVVVLCRKFKYNIGSCSWFLFVWNLVGISLAATGVLLPPMAAGFTLLGSFWLISRALK